MTGFTERLRALMDERGMSTRTVARAVPCDPGYVSKLATGAKHPSDGMARRLDEILHADGELAALGKHAGHIPAVLALGDEVSALEFVRHTAASDLGSATLNQLEQGVDDLAVSYQGTPPAELLVRIRAYLGYIIGLLDARKTLAEHRQLLVAGGWLSLLAATCLIDLGVGIA